MRNEFGLYEVQVDGRKYEFEKWGAEEALDVLLDISSIIGGPVGQALGKAFSPEGSGLDTVVDASVLSTVLEGLTKNLKKDVVKSILKKLCSEKCQCEGKRVNFNTHYAGDEKENGLLHMFKVAKAALEVQYGSFFAASKGVAAPVAVHPVINRA